jgi:DNA replication and repair protein RecF
MIIKSVDLNNFRNYKDLSVEFDKGTNILYGNNAQGKTNLLEALYMSGTSKSYKGAKDREMINFDESEGHIKTIVEKGDREYRIDIHLRKNKTKGIAINKVPIRKTSELFGILDMVFFSPEDLNIIKNGPSERRRFMDNELCQLDKIYLNDLKNYYKALDQRNKLLKDIYEHPELRETLDIWDKQLVTFGKNVIKRRKLFISELKEITTEIHKKLTKGAEILEISYECDSTYENFEERVFLNRDHDIRFSTTSVGPHRDDISIKVKNVDMRKYGSQGQQRTCALSLKLSELKLLENHIHDKPVLLLDDVLSELDKERQYDLLDSISDIQTIITCTGLEDFVENRFELNKIFHVVNGTISDYKN